MATNTLQSRRYAQAIFELALAKKELEKWQADLKKVWALAQNPEFSAVMDNPKYTFEAKSKLLLTQIKDIQPLVLKFTYLLTSLEKFSLITEIFAEFQQLMDDYKGLEKVQVTTAVALDSQAISQLTEKIARQTGKKVVLESNVDPGIIGGIVLRFGGKLIDGSTSSRLSALKNEISGSGA